MNEDAYKRYGRQLRFTGGFGAWEIVDTSTKSEKNHWNGDVVFTMPYHESHDDSDEPPAELRAEYERLIDWKDGDHTGEPFNIVEFVTDEDCAFDQPCQFGHRVDGHAVYCHNTSWLYAPRKCRRTWYTGGEVRDEDCPGYKPNGTKEVKSAYVAATDENQSEGTASLPNKPVAS